MRAERKNFAPSDRKSADVRIADNLVAALSDRQSFFVYHSYGSEADTHALISWLLALGKPVYLPRVEGSEMSAVRYTPSTPLIKSPMGISEPQGEAFGGDIGVVILPLLAVNSRGYRLGYGGGYYDRYLSRHAASLKVGIGYGFQLVGDAFEEEWDIPLDMFVCERGIIKFRQDVT